MLVAVQPKIKPESLPPEEPALCRLECQGVPLVASFPTSVQEHAFLQRLAPQSKILKACFFDSVAERQPRAVQSGRTGCFVI